MTQIALSELTGNGRVQSLSGQERGLSARSHYQLDDLDSLDSVVTVTVPPDLDAISPSFFQGMFAKSLLESFGRNPEAFLEHYSFNAPAHVLTQVQRGINAVLTRRPGQKAAA